MQQFFGMTFGTLMLVAIASATFFRIISPINDPSFDPTMGAGSLVPVLQGVGEAPWLIGASALAILLASNLVVIIWAWSHPRLPRLQRSLARVVAFILWLALGFATFSGLWLTFVHYLLSLWIVD